MSIQEAHLILGQALQTQEADELLVLLKSASKLVRASIKKTENGNRDNWRTPIPVYNALCEQYQVFPVIDACADISNSKCALFMDVEMNALTTDWRKFSEVNKVDPIFFMNPPYSNTTEWVKKAWYAALDGCTVLCLLHNDTSTAWYQAYVKPIANNYPEDHDFPKGRIKFEPPPGIKASTPRSGNCTVVFRPEKVRSLLCQAS